MGIYRQNQRQKAESAKTMIFDLYAFMYGTVFIFIVGGCIFHATEKE